MRFILRLWPTLGPDGLRDGAGVAEAVRVDRPDDKEVNGVGEESDDRVPLLLHMVCYRLPGAAHRLAAGGQKKRVGGDMSLSENISVIPAR